MKFLSVGIYVLILITIVYGQTHDNVSIPTDRNALGRFLNGMKFTRGAVIHINSDEAFATHLLSDWTRCTYFAIDFSIPNVNSTTLERLSYEETKGRFLHRMNSMVHPNIQIIAVDDNTDFKINAPLDFIYLHFQPDDYCIVYQLLTKWWTKLAPRGVMSGFHFVDDNTQTDFLRDYKNPVPVDWVFCSDKKTTRRAGLVREGVARFAKEHGVTVYTTTEQDIVHSFFMQKSLQ